MSTAVESSFDVAFWFSDAASEQNEYLQPQKLHRLLFLAQAYYAVAFDGDKLMPAVFIAEEIGPIEPNIYRAFSKGRPNIDAEIFMHTDVESFLNNIWRRFGNLSIDRLNKLCNETLAFKKAFKAGKRTDITLDAMMLSFARAKTIPDVNQVVKPKVLRTQEGKVVTVARWKPLSKSAAEAGPIHKISTSPRDSQAPRLDPLGSKKREIGHQSLDRPSLERSSRTAKSTQIHRQIKPFFQK